MGSYSVLKVNEVDIYECKNTIDSIIPIIFDYNGNIKKYIEKIDEDDFEKIEFSCKVEEALNRLLIKRNIDMKSIEDKFNNSILENVDMLVDAEENVESEEDIEEFIVNKYKFKDWIEAQKQFIKEIINKKNTNKAYPEYQIGNSSNVFLKNMKDKLSEGYCPMYMFDFELNFIPEEVFFLLLKSLDRSDVISCDISDVLDSGYMSLDEVEDMFEKAPRAVLLTEGTSDMYFIRDVFSIIYPQYSSSFYFTDLTKVKSDCEVLKNYLLMLAATGTPGNYIGIFDNDTAANEHYKEAKKKNKSPNIKIIKLPYQTEFESYPCKSVSGKIEFTNINDLAVSIELFYPDGVLKENDNFTPIIWSEHKTNQGNVENKNALHNRWNKYTKTVKQDYDKNDFRRAVDLLDSIINAFIQ